MSRSVLLQLARDSIVEVFQAQRSINKVQLIEEHPLLSQKIRTQVNIYLDKELRGSAESSISDLTLIEDIIRNAKRSAFEDSDFPPLCTSEYLSCEIEIILTTPDGVISEKDEAIIKNDNPKLETILRQK